MVTFKTYNDLVISTIELLRLTLNNLDTKPGTVARDLFVDIPAEHLANLYTELRNISNLQSFFSSSGTDLTRLGSNFGVSRTQGSNATGVAVLTTDSLDVDILIPQNTIFTSRSGVTFRSTSTTTMTSVNTNVFRANASRLRSDLELVGITDSFAIEVNVEAVTPGVGGNIGKFSLASQNIPGISNITNINPFAGGTNAESDSQYRNRILSIFAGSNTGTTLGYETAITINPNVSDVEVVVPGDPLLIRDGTQTSTDINGNLIVSDPGTGGKVDIYVLGQSLGSNIDSFIYNDQSGLDDPTNVLNDFVLGQQGEDHTTNISQRRVTLIRDNLLPLQPVENIISVAGSLSGGNFIERFVDTDGSVKGNFELFKDPGDFGGSPFGFDKLRWISDQIELDDESITKGIFNGSDALDFSDVTEIRDVTQDILITNEDPVLNSSNRSLITLAHTPIRTVSRVINLTTGERYIVSNQNPNGNLGELNTSGVITISGNTLPSGTDILQVDYIWVKPYDDLVDFDNLIVVNNFRTTQDSIDWSYNNLVKFEPSTAIDAYGVLTVEVTHNVSRIIEVATFKTETAVVSNGNVNLSETVSNVIDIRRVSDGAELFNTDAFDGTLSGSTTILLPTDTLAADDDSVVVRFNTSDVFEPDDDNEGTFENNIITLPEAVVPDDTSVLVTYIADVRTLVSSTELSTLPIVRNGNKFTINSTSSGEQPTSYLFTDSTPTQILRFAPSYIRVDASSIGGSGTLGIVGTSFTKVSQALIVITGGNGFDIDLSSAIKSSLDVSSIPDTVSVARLASVERVTLDGSDNVSSVETVFDIINYTIKDNSSDFVSALADSTLNKHTVSLPRTENNTDNILSTGDVVRVTFYYMKTNDSDQLFFSKNGTLITSKKFLTIDRFSIVSGFTNNAGNISGDFIVLNTNQPRDNTTYDIDYNYIAPKENERITITFNTNNVIRDATISTENVRPITADVLIKAAVAKVIDMTIKIVKTSDTQLADETIIQNATDTVTSFLNANSLGTTIDSSDVINVLYTVSGVDRIQILTFSHEDSGNLLSISAEKNEFLQAGTVDISIEER